MTKSAGKYVNLANYIRLDDSQSGGRQWILTLYDGADNSTPTKLVIKGSDGKIVTDDELVISSDALYQDYTCPWTVVR